MDDKRYYSAPGTTGVLAFKFISKLMEDPTLNLSEPMVDNYLFEVGYEMGFTLDQTKDIIKWLEIRKMLV